MYNVMSKKVMKLGKVIKHRQVVIFDSLVTEVF